MLKHVLSDLMGVIVGSDVLMPILGFIIALFAQAFAVVKILDAKHERRMEAMDKRHHDEMTAIRTQVNRNNTEVHDRINNVKDTYVKRDDHDKDIRHLHDTILHLKQDLRQDISAGVTAFNSRVDYMQSSITELLTKITSGKN